MSKSDALAFWTVFLFVFFINIITPIVAEGLEQSVIGHDYDDVDATSPPSLTFTVLVSILLVPFWTLEMPVLMNLFIMIPVRVLAWYLLLRMIRGN